MKVGDYLYHYYKDIYNKMLYINRYKIVRETPTRWVLDNGEYVYKDSLKVVGSKYTYCAYEDIPKDFIERYNQQMKLLSASQFINFIKISFIKEEISWDEIKDMIEAILETKNKIEGGRK